MFKSTVPTLPIPNVRICTLHYILQTEINRIVGFVGAQAQGLIAPGREREQKIGLSLQGDCLRAHGKSVFQYSTTSALIATCSSEVSEERLRNVLHCMCHWWTSSFFRDMEIIAVFSCHHPKHIWTKQSRAWTYLNSLSSPTLMCADIF